MQSVTGLPSIEMRMLGVVRTPLTVVRCPTRAAAALVPSRPSSVINASGQVDSILDGALVARSDYAVCEGDYYLTTAPIDPKSSSWMPYCRLMNGTVIEIRRSASCAHCWGAIITTPSTPWATKASSAEAMLASSLVASVAELIV